MSTPSHLGGARVNKAGIKSVDSLSSYLQQGAFTGVDGFGRSVFLSIDLQDSAVVARRKAWYSHI